MVAHHHGVLEEEEVGASSEFFDFGQGPGWCRRRTNGNQLWELELIFLAGVLAVFQIFAMDLTKNINKI